jgi:hypothetical protein
MADSHRAVKAVRSFDFHITGNSGSLIRCTRHRPKSRIRLRSGRKSVQIYSPRLEWAPNLLRRGSEYYWRRGLAVGDAIAAGTGVMFQVFAAPVCQANRRPVS